MSVAGSMASETGILALVLAAGRSRRFGTEDKRRAALEEGGSLLATTYGRVSEIFPVVRVVLPPGEEPTTLGLPENTAVIYADACNEGIGGTLRSVFRYILEQPSEQTCDVVAIFLGDMPWLNASTVKMLSSKVGSQRIVRPAYESQPGHPVFVGREFWPEFLKAAGDKASDVLARGGSDLDIIPVDDTGVVRDVDYPEDLVRHR